LALTAQQISTLDQAHLLEKLLTQDARASEQSQSLKGSQKQFFREDALQAKDLVQFKRDNPELTPVKDINEQFKRYTYDLMSKKKAQIQQSSLGKRPKNQQTIEEVEESALHLKRQKTAKTSQIKINTGTSGLVSTKAIKKGKGKTP